jgi:hypothetical protein
MGDFSQFLLGGFDFGFFGAEFFAISFELFISSLEWVELIF